MTAKRHAPAERQPQAPRLVASLPVARLSRSEPLTIDVQPSPAELADAAKFLGLTALERVRLKARAIAEDEDCWRVEGRLTARAVQACIITLEPVPQTIDEAVSRLYVPEARLEAGPELDLDIEEDDPDGFDREIDLDTLVYESLALALDPYPRAEGAELNHERSAPPGVDPLTDDALKPFAKLEALRAKLAGGDG
ncbi:MAG: DUF177 domain-containing protein [Pseudomonadota bacterium]